MYTRSIDSIDICCSSAPVLQHFLKNVLKLALAQAT